jgi:hypothetical protein
MIEVSGNYQQNSFEKNYLSDRRLFRDSGSNPPEIGHPNLIPKSEKEN